MLEILICKCSRTLAKCRASAPCERCVATKGSRTAVERGRGEGESIGWIDFTFRFEFQIFYCRQLSKGVAGSAFLLLVISGPKSFKFASFFWTTRKYSILLRTAVWIDNRKYFRTGRRGGGLDVMATNARAWCGCESKNLDQWCDAAKNLNWHCLAKNIYLDAI